jgi:DNA-binding response OmpR family regulator
MPTRTGSILLVEDDQSLQDGLRSFFEDSGFETHAAGTRADGQRLLRDVKPAVCILDLNLPDGSGLDLLRLIVQERLPVRVIVMSALPEARLRQQYPASVLAAMMTKPASPQELLEVVESVVKNA